MKKKVGEIKCKNSSNTVNQMLHVSGSQKEQSSGMDTLWWVELLQYTKATLKKPKTKQFFENWRKSKVKLEPGE